MESFSNESMEYNHKVIRAGDIVETYVYEKPIAVGVNANPNGRRGKSREGLTEEQLIALEEERARNEERRVHRAKTAITRLVNSNSYQWQDDTGKTYKPVFLTLTFAENITDLPMANKEFTRFKKSLDKFLKRKIEYIAVPEFQKRGAVHYHVLIFNMPFVPVEILHRIWGNGGIDIKALRSRNKDCDNVGAYISKYITKALKGNGGLDERLKGKKSYFCSNGLIKPDEQIVTKEELEGLAGALTPYMVYENDYRHDCTGNIHYTQYNLKR